MQWIEQLSVIGERYPFALCDVWGVIHNGREAFPAACAALSDYQAKGGLVALLTNAPRPAADVRRQLQQLGVPDTAYTLIATSGMATQDLLRQYAQTGAAYALGPDKDNGIYVGLDITFADIDAASFISCTGLVDDETETDEDYRPLLTYAAARQLPLICANPDKWVHRGHTLIPCAGLLGALYKTLGGPVVFGGKPHAAIYDLALRMLSQHTGHAIDRTQVLAIGDGLETDVKGANLHNLDCLFIAGGLAEVDTAEGAQSLLDQSGRHARWGMAKLA